MTVTYLQRAHKRISIFYFEVSNIALPESLKYLFAFNVAVMGSVFFIYPRYGLRVLFVNVHSVIGFSSSNYATYHFSGGIFSPDLAFTPAITIYIFLVANRASGIAWAVIGLGQLLVFYYAAEQGLLPFREVTSTLSTSYYLLNIQFSMFFAVFIILLYENMMKGLIGIINEDKAQLERNRKEITDSITYALRIQQAKLPDLSEMAGTFPESFVLYKPKDIVSGDFYFFRRRGEDAIIAAADCTGHGVPGALMSMIGSEKLDDLIGQGLGPSEALARLNQGIKATLRQTEGHDSSKDGMDIALCSINPAARTVTYAGANRPLWIVRNGGSVVEEVKATRAAIGGITPDSQQFPAHTLQLHPGDTLYLHTDGFADQFGGEGGKKLTAKRFKSALLSIQSLGMKSQMEHLSTLFEQWRGNEEQVDDILVVGIRV